MRLNLGIDMMTDESIYNRHIRKCRGYVKGLIGWERATGIRDYFNKTIHPHPSFTLHQMAGERCYLGDSDRNFSYRLMCEMASLTVVNEVNFPQNDNKGL
jgi:hypothetical protein